ncbi:MAG: hypothetical protein JWQ27_242 [Ferruginibacter sp.]|nr:hypothetical protein [Ferruginibacter sp.]
MHHRMLHLNIITQYKSIFLRHPGNGEFRCVCDIDGGINFRTVKPILNYREMEYPSLQNYLG